jgi:membrane protein YqaA with SNARE-associated domain
MTSDQIPEEAKPAESGPPERALPSERATPSRQATPSRRTLTAVLRILALVVVVGLSVYIYTIRNQAEQFAAYGYPGIFLIAFLAYATVLLPAPGAAVIFAMGAVFNPAIVGLVAGAGAALGEVSGYLAGFSTQAVIERASIYHGLTGWMKRSGSLTILILSAIPNPLFDMAGLVAGALKMPVWKFLFWCWIGETIKMLTFAYAGAGLLSLFE